MVVSKLDSTINYQELKDINPDDKGKESTIFIMEMNDVNVVLSLGTEQYTFITKNVIYIPIYLVHEDRVVGKIGLYEFMASDMSDLLDADGDYDVENFNEPVLYSYVNKDYLEKYKYIGDDSESPTGQEQGDDEEGEVVFVDDDSEDEDESSSDDEIDVTEDAHSRKSDARHDKQTSSTIDIDEADSLEEIQEEHVDDDVLPSVIPIIRELYEEDEDIIEEEKEGTPALPIPEGRETEFETEKEANQIKERFTLSESENWIQSFFKNPFYEIEDNEGGGDCFFAVLREAFKSIGKNVTVNELRTILANELTDEVYENFKLMYNMAKSEYDDITRDMKRLKKENDNLKKQLKSAKTSTEKKVLVDQGKKNASHFKELKGTLYQASELVNEYRFMKDVDNIEDMKEVIKTCRFWAETWAISTMERVLNIKLLVLSSTHYEKRDYNNVLQCGQLNDVILEERGVFKPKYYIMTEWLGDHYKTIAYKGNKILTFNQIPFDMKKLIVDKCLERNAGPFYIIPKFKTLKEEMERKEQESGTMDLYISLEEPDETSEEVSEKKSSVQSPDRNIVFQYYERSADMKPGKGSGEKIPETERKNFLKLEKIKDWRKMLSNSYIHPYKLNGKTWNSIEHYMQAMKFKQGNPHIYNNFSLESGTDWASDVKIAKSVGETGKVKGEKVLAPSIKPDPGYEQNRASYMKDAMLSKFSTPVLGEVLRETKNATLQIYVPRRPAIKAEVLMSVRTIMNS